VINFKVIFFNFEQWTWFNNLCLENVTLQFLVRLTGPVGNHIL
jgi:hypothetical protein